MGWSSEKLASSLAKSRLVSPTSGAWAKRKTCVLNVTDENYWDVPGRVCDRIKCDRDPWDFFTPIYNPFISRWTNPYFLITIDPNKPFQLDIQVYGGVGGDPNRPIPPAKRKSLHLGWFYQQKNMFNTNQFLWVVHLGGWAQFSNRNPAFFWKNQGWSWKIN